MPNLTNASFISNQAVNLYGRDYWQSMHVAYVVIGVLMKEFTDMDSVN